MVICSLHFTPDCFSGLGNRKNLLWNAVPTLFAAPHQDAKVNQVILKTTNTQCAFHLSQCHLSTVSKIILGRG